MALLRTNVSAGPEFLEQNAWRPAAAECGAEMIGTGLLLMILPPWVARRAALHRSKKPRERNAAALRKKKSVSSSAFHSVRVTLSANAIRCLQICVHRFRFSFFFLIDAANRRVV